MKVKGVQRRAETEKGGHWYDAGDLERVSG